MSDAKDNRFYREPPPTSRDLPSKQWLESWAAYFDKRAEDFGGLHIGPDERRMIAQTFRDLSALSEKQPIKGIAIVKMMQGQRDEIWDAALDVLRHCDAKSEGETDFERAVIALRAACAKVPSYQQRLDNIFKGLADVE